MFDLLGRAGTDEFKALLEADQVRPVTANRPASPQVARGQRRDRGRQGRRGGASSGSGAMLAETLHSFADCGNQLLLLVGCAQATKPADHEAPARLRPRDVLLLVHRRAAAVLRRRRVLDLRGHPQDPSTPSRSASITIALIILGVLDRARGLVDARQHQGDEQAARAPSRSSRYLRDTKDSDLIVVFGENSAAVLGLLLATAALILAKETGDGRWDAHRLARDRRSCSSASRRSSRARSSACSSASPPIRRSRATFEQLADDDPNVEQRASACSPSSRARARSSSPMKLEFRRRHGDPRSSSRRSTRSSVSSRRACPRCAGASSSPIMLTRRGRLRRARRLARGEAVERDLEDHDIADRVHVLGGDRDRRRA